MKNCRLNLIYRANCNSLVLNWLQEQSTCHIGVDASLILSYFFLFHFITQLLTKYLNSSVHPAHLDPERQTTNHFL